MLLSPEYGVAADQSFTYPLEACRRGRKTSPVFLRRVIIISPLTFFVAGDRIKPWFSVDGYQVTCAPFE